MADNFNNIMFKRGAQASLNSLMTAVKAGTKSFAPGAFYLTTDTDRLYVAQAEDELVELNKSITVVDYATADDRTAAGAPASATILPASNEVEKGQFYYVSHGNILCIYNGTQWLQVNPDNDHNDDTRFTAPAFSAGVFDNDGNLTYTFTYKEKDKNGAIINASGFGGSAPLTIKAEDIVRLGGVAVDIDAAAGGDNEAVLSLGGSGADTASTAGKVTLKAGKDVGINVSGNVVTIQSNDTKSNLSSGANSTKIDLKDQDGTPQGSVTLEADETYIHADGTTANKVAFSHKISGVTAGTYGETGKEIAHRPSSVNTPTDGMKFQVPKLTVDAAGHVTTISSETFIIPKDNDTTYTVGSISAKDNGKLSVVLKEDGVNLSAVDSDSILYHKITVDGTEQTVYNQKSLGSFYSAAKIDEKLNAVNAMTYKGTVGGTGATASALPTSGVKIGDTYMVAKDDTYDGKKGYVGDLFIATGTETNGVITSGLAWTLVPSGNYPDTQYAMTVVSGTGKGMLQLRGTDDYNVQVDFVGEGPLSVVGTPAATGVNGKIAISHAGIASGVDADTEYGPSAGGTLNSGDKFIVPSVTFDDYGHIAAVAEREFTLPTDTDTKYHLDVNNANKSIALRDSETAANGSVTLSQGNAIEVTVTGGDADTHTADNATVTIKHSDVTRTDPTVVEKSQLGYGNTSAAGKFTVVSGVTTNAQGHVTAVAKETYQLPKETAVTVVNTAASNKFGVKVNDDMAGTLTLTGTYTATEGGVKVTSSASGNNLTTNIALVWGTFD